MTELDELRLALIRAGAAERRVLALVKCAQRAVDVLANIGMPAEERCHVALAVFAEIDSSGGQL